MQWPNSRTRRWPPPGARSQGNLTANSEREVHGHARRRAACSRCASRRPSSGRSGSFGGRRIRTRNLATFYAQLADLLHSGVPLLRSLDILERQVSQAGPVGGAPRGARPRRRRHRPGRGDGSASAGLRRTGRQHGPRRPGRRLPRRRAPPHRRLHRTARKTSSPRSSAPWPTPSSCAVAGFVVLNVLVIFFVPKFEPIFKKLEEKGELPFADRRPDRHQPFPAARGAGCWCWSAVLAASSCYRRWASTEKGRLHGRRPAAAPAGGRARSICQPGPVALHAHPRHAAAQRHSDLAGACASPRIRPATAC